MRIFVFIFIISLFGIESVISQNSNLFDTKKVSNLTEENTQVSSKGTFTVSLSRTNTACYGICDGEITVTLSGAPTYPMTVRLYKPAELGGGFQDYTNLSAIDFPYTIPNLCGAASQYTIRVTDNELAQQFSNIAVMSPAPIDITETITPLICSGEANASINLMVSGGFPGYTYSWMPNLGTGTSLTNLPAGTYIVTVADANLCTATETYTINNPPSIPLYTLSGGGAMCAEGAGLNIILNGSTANINYQLKLNGLNLGVAIPGTGVPITWPNQTSAGTYTVEAINTNMCTQSMSGSVSIIINSLPIVDAGGDQNIPMGTPTNLSGSASGGSGSYTYSWTPSSSLVTSNVQNPTTFPLSSTITFTLQVTDLTYGCVASDDVVINVGGSTLTVNPNASSSVICIGESITLNANASGGTGTYTYSWSSLPAAFNSTLSNPSDSPFTTTTYSVTVNDGGNSASGDVTVTVVSMPITYDVMGGGTYCPPSSGVSVELMNSEPQTNYQLFINGTPSGSPLMGGAGMLKWPNQTTTGTYTVQATNTSTGCLQMMNGSVNVTAGVSPFPYGLTGGGNYCSNTSGVSVGLSNTDFQTSYQLYFDGSALPIIVPGTGSPIDFGLQTQQGNYTVYATHNSGCTSIMPGSVNVNIYPAQVIDNIIATEVTSCVAPNGTLTINISGGTAPYQYSINSGGSQPGNVFSNLNSGMHSILVISADGCEVADMATITNAPDPIIDSIHVTDLTCFEGNNGAIFIYSNDAISYSIDNAVSFYPSSAFTGLPAGNYDIFIKNSGECFAYTSVTLLQPLQLVLNEAVSNPSCLNNDGSILLTPVGGVSPYTYNWQNMALSGDIANNLSEGVYAVSVTDVNGCMVSKSIPLFMESVNPVIKGLVSYSGGQLLTGDASVEAYSKLDIPQGSVLFELDQQQVINSTGFAFNVVPGTYILRAINENTTLYPQLLNTYYPNIENWEFAVEIIASCDDTIPANIVMNETAAYTPGNSIITGFINYYDGNGKGVSSGSGKAQGEPVIGAEIFIEQEPNDEPISSAYTDNNGMYEFENLSAGDGYRLLVEIPGIPVISTYYDFSISSDGIILENYNFYVDTTDEIGGIFTDTLTHASQLSLPFAQVSIYPNPAHDFINLSISSENKEVYIELLSSDGKELSKVIYQDKGNDKQIINIPLSSYQKGIYFIKISDGKSIYVKKIRKE